MLKNLPAGPKGKVPDIVYCIVEVPMNSRMKYEVDDKTGAIFVDRVLYSTLTYPGDYGTIPSTLSGDGDPLDVLVIVTAPNYPGVVIPVRPVGMLVTKDEKGKDTKIIAVPDSKVDPRFKEIEDIKNIPEHIREEIKYFYEHYKELEPKKWVKVVGFKDAKAAKKEIQEAVNNFKTKK